MGDLDLTDIVKEGETIWRLTTIAKNTLKKLNCGEKCAIDAKLYKIFAFF